MNELQLFLLLLALGIFFIFFKQLFSGDFQQRGVEPVEVASGSRVNIFNLSDEDKLHRIQHLTISADKALKRGDTQEAEKAIMSLLALDSNNLGGKRMLAVTKMNQNDYKSAKEILLDALKSRGDDDLSHTLLANVLHKLGEDKEAISHHKRAIELDPNYAKHYFDYANTLYDLGEIEEAKANYKKAVELDPSLKESIDGILKDIKS